MHRAFPVHTLQIFRHTVFATLIAFLVLPCAGVEFAWQDTNTYRPPDFEATFPIDSDSGREIEKLWTQYERNGPPPDTVFEIMRRGLRTVPIDRQMSVLRWFGNEFIWNKSPQNPRAIDLMYHAAGCTNREISYNAIYFGLSTVRPLTEPIMRALVDIAIRSEDPNVLSRIAWAGSAHKNRLLHYLKPELTASEPARREHAETLRKIFSGELKAFVWAAEQAKRKAEVKYTHRLEEFRSTLTTGDSEARRELLSLIQQERIALVMDESFIPAFAAAAADADYRVREAVATTAGGRWVWNASDQAPEAIELMMKLSRDDNRNVRYDANYYGLSTIRRRTDAEVERMIEMALHDGLDNPDFLHRITWGLERDRELVRHVLQKWIAAFESDLVKAVYACGFHLGFLKSEPEVSAELRKILDDGGKPVAVVLGFLPRQGLKVNSIEEFITQLRQELPAHLAARVPWNNDDGFPFMILEKRDETALRTALLNSSRFNVEGYKSVSVQNLIDLGKGVRFQNLK